jgi:polar amino acid transport system substrate-binding protein
MLRNNRALSALPLLILCLAVACSNLPRDPKETLRAVQTRPMRVGLVEHSPWVIRTTGEPAGVEVDLVRQFAAALGTTPEWHWGSEQEQLEALEEYQLDLVIGGLTDRSPWRKYVGMTSTYFTETYRVGVQTSSPLENVKGAQVAILRGEPAAAELEKKGAVVVRVDDLSQVTGAVAAPDWQLEQMSRTGTNIELDSVKHVFAVPPGENGFLKRLDEFLHAKSGEIKGRLQQQVSMK